MTRRSEEQYQEFKVRQEKLAPLPRDLEYHDLAGADDSELQTCLQRARAGWRRNPGAQDAGTHTSGPPALNRRIDDDEDQTTLPFANLEQAPSHAPLGQKKGARLDSPCRIHIHSRRYRLADPDGISAKAAIDGLILTGVLPDDSPKFIKEVTFSQEKIGKEKVEETIIVVEKLDLKGVIMPLWGGI